MTTHENYKVDERSKDYILKYGSAEIAITNLQKELDEYDSLWSKYSCDCLGHAITCLSLIIRHLKQPLPNPPKAK